MINHPVGIVGSSRFPATPSNWQRLVLVTGHTRGGTTWLGQLLTLASRASYIFEPLTHSRHPSTSQVELLTSFNRESETWLTPWPPTCEQEAQYAFAVVQHVHELVDTYFHGPVANLILKQPGIERFPLLYGALQPDVAVYIKRHPVAILNSYRSARLYEGWNVARQFERCRRDVILLRPDLVHMFDDVGDDHDARILSMCCIAHQIADEWAARGKLLVLDYEQLAFGGPSTCVQLFDRLGLELPNDKTAELNRFFVPEKPQRGFLETQKVSARRANAYLTELAPWQLAKARRYLQRIGYPAEVPSQNAHAQILGDLEYCRRAMVATKRTAHAALSHAIKRVLGSDGNRSGTSRFWPRLFSRRNVCGSDAQSSPN